MKYFIYFIACLLLVSLQIGLFGLLPIRGVAPDLLLLFVVGCCLQPEADDSFIVAFFAGLFLDFLNGFFVGSFTFGFLSLALLLSITIHRLVVFELSWKYLLTATAAATIFVDVWVVLANAIGFHYGWSVVAINWQVLQRHVPLEIVYNLVLAYPMYALATWLRNLILSLQGKKHRII